MAVTLTRAQLAVEIRVIADESEAIPAGQAAVLDRTLAAAAALVDGYAPNAPVAVANEAAVRMAGRALRRGRRRESRGQPHGALWGGAPSESVPREENHGPAR